jgi:hypothetical protein
MTMNRLITSLVQMGLAGVCFYCIRLMLPDLKDDVKEFTKLIRK